ncbi:CPCC family cysteine-rich protein [Clostridium sp. BNL1100]|uniref:CPCC family cysteine-rich protein n=1 Tax=Clostridium sp. BNL1100 TaxID=755731 RepID=UPI00024A75BE|nr:CPCC family cysteine-rich protein [Clostridium sp. BNL1100]AEY65574.1 hypothetical protein Clo1100_1333 [Clostridium sp. BNL1100]
MKRIKCPCCGYYTIESEDEVIADICGVCFWQYDWIAQKYPDKIIGPNKISLNEATKNYKQHNISDLRFKNEKYTRNPLPEELPQNNE